VKEPSTLSGQHVRASVEVAETYVKAVAAASELTAGTTLGAYQVLELIGKGGMGEVYLALHKLLDRRVALKLLRAKYASNRSAVKRFFMEARAACRINHPNIVSITDFVEDEGGICFYVMEYLAGETLGARIARGPLPLPELLRIGFQIIEALAALHDAGVIHRDLKPGNIFLEQLSEGAERAKLLDFGLVKIVESTGPIPSDAEGPKTDPDSIIGTPEYMSPEQIRGKASGDPRTDIYAFGAILYEMATGVRPLVGTSLGDLMVKVVTEVPVSPTERGAPDLPAPLAALIMSCLQKRPEDRPESAASVLELLRAIAAGESPAGFTTLPAPSAPLTPAAPARARGRWLAAGAVVLLLAGLAWLGARALGPRRAGTPAAREPASGGAERAGASIATLKEMWHQVQHRARAARSWGDATRGMGLHHLDTLRTGAGGHARVAFHRGGRLDVDEQSEVLIVAPPGSDGEQARVARGTVRVTAQPGRVLRLLTPDGKEVVIRARGSKPAQIRARLEGERTELATLEGSADLSVGGRSLELRHGQLVDLERGRFREPLALPAFPELTSPAVDATLGSRDVTLRWREVPGARAYRVQLSTFINFEEKLVNTVVVGTELPLSALSPDRYIWRVSSRDPAGHEGEFGYARRFVILRSSGTASAPHLPADNATLEVGKRLEPVTFRWQGAEGARFQLIVATHRSLARGVVLRRTMNERSYVSEELKAGVYYWGVFAIDATGKRRPVVDPPRRLTIRQLQPPKLQLPAIEWK
jgi:tRNA A-37 threonylcarbamoyl transferase component Bud32